MPDYWNHNTAYHPWILRAVAERPVRDALDVGCGDGLFLTRLAPLVDTATGLEPDPGTYERARVRLADVDNVTVRPCSFEDWGAGAGSVDLVTMVASLHHMDLTGALEKTRELLRPGGQLLVVGLAANRSATDWLFSGLQLPWVRLFSALHRESPDIGVPVAEAEKSLAEIRAEAERVLPGVRVRRGLYYRYLLRWVKPG